MPISLDYLRKSAILLTLLANPIEIAIVWISNMLGKLRRFFVTALLAVAAVGCNNGFNCPIDPPSCCFNLVFGCGLFDLPTGCSCSDFFSVPVAPATLVNSKSLLATEMVKVSKSPGISGRWNGDLGRVKNSCSVSLAQVSGNIVVKKEGTRATIEVPNYGVLKGQTKGALTTARGSYRQGGCQADVGASVRNLRAGKARSVVSAKISCKDGLSCSAQFRGELKKIN